MLKKCIKRSISGDLLTRYDSHDITKHLRIAAFLDPRFKDLNPIVPAYEHKCIYDDTKAGLLSLVDEPDDDKPAELD